MRYVNFPLDQVCVVNIETYHGTSSKEKKILSTGKNHILVLFK